MEVENIQPLRHTVHTVFPETVLVVDDEAIVLDVLSVALGKKNLTVRTVSRLADAVRLLETEQFGCVLVDKNLPDGTGLDLIRKVRELQPFAACMVMTGYPNAASILEALRLGAVDYLEKPFPQMSIVQEKVRAAIDRQKVAAEHAALLERVRELSAQKPQEDFRETAELAMLEQSLAVAKEDAQHALEEQRARMQGELEALNTRLDAVKYRHVRSVGALRKGATHIAILLERGGLPQALEQELRELRRELISVLDEVGESGSPG